MEYLVKQDINKSEVEPMLCGMNACLVNGICSIVLCGVNLLCPINACGVNGY